MINQPFAGQAVWFVFITPYNYSNIDWENFEREIVFNESPIYLLSSEKEIFETMDLESKEFREKTKNNIKNFQKAKGDNSTSISMLQKIIDTKHIWRRVLDFANQPPIQFAGIDDNGNTFDKQKIGELPKWLKYSKKVTMEIWEDQYYYNKIYDGNDIYCFMEVVL